MKDLTPVMVTPVMVTPVMELKYWGSLNHDGRVRRPWG
jgi:hypothetical protein